MIDDVRLPYNYSSIIINLGMSLQIDPGVVAGVEQHFVACRGPEEAMEELVGISVQASPGFHGVTRGWRLFFYEVLS